MGSEPTTSPAQLQPIPRTFRSAEHRGVGICLGDALEMYPHWPSPVVIVSDGACGLSGFPGDTPTVEGLTEWYRPHVAAWSEASPGETTLWFWKND